jgi:DNA polymerase I-like protein with 3'-5' exonuclease and polymerase domains
VQELDIETTGLQAFAGDLPFLVQFYDGESPPVLLRHPEDSAEVQRRLLMPGEEYRAWNAKFDNHGLRQGGYELPPETSWHDGMIAAHIVDERSSVALQAKADALGVPHANPETEAEVHAFLAAEDRRRRKVAKDAGERFVRANYSDVPDEIMHPYAAHDVLAQREVCDIIMPAIERNPEFRALYEMERGCLAAMFWMEDRGVPFDRDELIRLEAHLLPQIDAAEELCVRISEFKNFNPRSPKQISEALDRLGADVRFMTRDSSTKQLKTDEENLEACTHPLAGAVLNYRGIHRMWTWVRRILHGDPDDKKFPKPYLTADDLVHPNFRQVGARTGRMSCSNPNFQNIHRDDLRPRYCVRAQPGMKLVCVDLDGIEMRLEAAFAGDGPLKEMLISGADPHQYTADQLGLTGRTRSTGAFESARDQGKRFNYLKPYGGGVNAIGKFLRVPREPRGRWSGATRRPTRRSSASRIASSSRWRTRATSRPPGAAGTACATTRAARPTCSSPTCSRAPRRTSSRTPWSRSTRPACPSWRPCTTS